jgi:solute carrier family 25 citrate transporter 1
MASAVYFWGYEFTKQAIGPSVGSTAGIVLGGMVAQAAAGLIYTPMDVIKERQQARCVPFWSCLCGRGFQACDSSCVVKRFDLEATVRAPDACLRRAACVVLRLRQ